MQQKEIDTIITSFPHLPLMQDVPLASFTYMKVGGPAQLFVELHNVDELYDLCSFCFIHAVPFVVLGGASNTVISDAGIQKLVIINKTKSLEFNPVEGTEKVRATADSGVITAMFANDTMSAGLTGLEYFVGVPGTIGGAIVNNSHFTLHELIGNSILHVEVCTPEGKREVWPKEQLKFGYDYSIFHEVPAIVLRATFELYKGDQVHIQEKMLEAAKKRVATQPIGVPSTGCMFRNPAISSEQLTAISAQITVPKEAVKTEHNVTQIAAGFLIDQAGLKGTTVGGAQVSDKHATYIINLGAATSEDIDALATKVEQKVQDKFGIKLEREVFFIQ